MSLTLALNACEGRLQIALGTETETLCAEDWAAPSRGAEILAPAVAEMCARLNLTPAQISRIACVRGPGSFTGIRLTLSFAAAFKRVNKAILAGLDYMHLLALGVAELTTPNDALWVLTHARRNLIHCQVFNHKIEAVSDIELISPAEAATRINAGVHNCEPDPAQSACRQPHHPCGTALLMGSGLARNNDFFSQNCPSARFLPQRFNSPNAADLLLFARQAAFSESDIEPLYVRPCDAVENLERISIRAGRDPMEAMAELDRLSRLTLK